MDSSLNVMRLSAAVDLYYLIALAQNPPTVGKRAQEKLYNDVIKARDELAADLARALFDYLYLVCFGEGRHAKDRVNGGGFYYKETDAYKSRKSSYGLASHYNPMATLEQLGPLFDQIWESGYGGTAWQKIAAAALQYQKWPDIVFIDHVIDICHNGGLAFDKFETSQVIHFCLDISSDRFMSFLTFKRDVDDILAKEPPIDISIFLSERTTSLLQRYHRTYLQTEPPSWIDSMAWSSASSWPKYKTREWGPVTTLTVIEIPVEKEDEEDDIDTDISTEQEKLYVQAAELILKWKKAHPTTRSNLKDSQHLLTLDVK